MKEEELSEDKSKAILESLDKAISDGPWDESNFLRVIGKKLREIRDRFANRIRLRSNESDKAVSHLANRIALRSGQREIFIALYSATGSNIQSWTHILANLPRQVTSRPVYANETDAKEAIGAKQNKLNEAYVSIYINTDDVLVTPEDKTPKDRLGKPLLSLKDRSIKIENINRLVHITGTYKYVGGRLIRQNND